MGSPPPLASTVTLGVQDFSRERDFYQRLGWPVVFESDGFAVIRLRGAVLALVQPGQLARDADAQAGSIRAGIRSAVIITMDRPGDVDELASRARAASASQPLFDRNLPVGASVSRSVIGPGHRRRAHPAGLRGDHDLLTATDDVHDLTRWGPGVRSDPLSCSAR